MPRTIATQRQLVRDFGTCLNFNGTNAQVIFNNASYKNNELTISLWLKQTPYTSGARALGWSAGGIGYEIDTEAGSNGLFKLRLYGTGGNTFYNLSTVLPVNYNYKWVHIVASVSMSGDFVKGYINGVLGTTTNGIRTDLTSSGTGNIEVGRYASGGFFNGLIDDVRIFNRALTTTEAQNLYYSGTNPVNLLPINWFKFDEGSGTTAQDSGTAALTGTITAATYSSDVFIKAPRTVATQRQLIRDFGACYNFDGTASVITVGNISSKLNLQSATPGSFSISGWFKPTANGPANGSGITLMNNGGAGRCDLLYQSNLKFGFAINIATTISNPTKTSPNTGWYHVVGVYDNSTGGNGSIYLYVNGVLVAGPTTPASIDLSAVSMNMTMGKINPTSGWFTGYIDEVQVYSGALSAANVQQLYYQGGTIVAPGLSLITYHKIDENTGTTTADSSGNAFTGTITAAAGGWSPDVFIKSPRTLVT